MDHKESGSEELKQLLQRAEARAPEWSPEERAHVAAQLKELAAAGFSEDVRPLLKSWGEPPAGAHAAPVRSPASSLPAVALALL